MKKIFIILAICLLFTGCTLVPKINKVESNEITTDYGTFTIPSTWVKRDDHSTYSKYFFANRNDNNNPPNNISVEKGTNYYATDDHIRFRQAILEQIGNQVKPYGGTVTSSGSTTKNGYTVYTFNIEGTGQKVVQHYIIGDYEYVLVHETIWTGDGKDCNDAAKTIVDSFEWKK